MYGGCDTCKLLGEENCKGCLWDGKSRTNTHWEPKEPFINKSYISMEEMKKQDEELIQQVYNRGYTAGYSKAETDYHAKTEDDRQSSYELGLNMAWEAFKTIHKLAPYCFLDCFPNGNDELYSLSINEVIRRVHEYEKKQEEDEEIRIGDEVILNGYYFPAIIIMNNGSNRHPYNVMFADGNTVLIDRDIINHKTGRTFPEIVELLKKMQEGENDQ